MEEMKEVRIVLPRGNSTWKKCNTCDVYLEDEAKLSAHEDKIHNLPGTSVASASQFIRNETSVNNLPSTSTSCQQSGSIQNGIVHNLPANATSAPKTRRQAVASALPEKEKDEPYIKPRIMTLSDLKGSGRGRSGPKRVDRDYAEVPSEDSEDEDAGPSRKRGRKPASKKGAKKATTGVAKKPKAPPKNGKAKNAPVASASDSTVPLWSTNGHVLKTPNAEATNGPTVPTDAEERRRMMAAAAEKRLQQVQNRGVQDTEAFRLKKQRQEEMERQQEEALRKGYGKDTAGSLKWQL